MEQLGLPLWGFFVLMWFLGVVTALALATYLAALGALTVARFARRNRPDGAADRLRVPALVAPLILAVGGVPAAWGLGMALLLAGDGAGDGAAATLGPHGACAVLALLGAVATWAQAPPRATVRSDRTGGARRRPAPATPVP